MVNAEQNNNKKQQGRPWKWCYFLQPASNELLLWDDPSYF